MTSPAGWWYRPRRAGQATRTPPGRRDRPHADAVRSANALRVRRGVSATPAGPRLSHDGALFTFTAYQAVLPASGYAIAVLANRGYTLGPNDADEIGHGLIAIAAGSPALGRLARLAVRRRGPRAGHPRSLLSGALGVWRSRSWADRRRSGLRTSFPLLALAAAAAVVLAMLTTIGSLLSDHRDITLLQIAYVTPATLTLLCLHHRLEPAVTAARTYWLPRPPTTQTTLPRSWQYRRAWRGGVETPKSRWTQVHCGGSTVDTPPARRRVRAPRSPLVRHVDDQPRTRTRAVQGEHPERQSRPHPQPDVRLALEAAGPGDLAERGEAADVHQFARVGGLVGRCVLVVGRRVRDDLQFRATAQWHQRTGAVLVDLRHVLDAVPVGLGPDVEHQSVVAVVAAGADVDQWRHRGRGVALRQRAPGDAAVRRGGRRGGGGAAGRVGHRPREMVAIAAASSVMMDVRRCRMGFLLCRSCGTPWTTYGCLTRTGAPALTRRACHIDDTTA